MHHSISIRAPFLIIKPGNVPRVVSVVTAQGMTSLAWLQSNGTPYKGYTMDRGIVWEKDEIEALISIWGQETIQAKFNSAGHRNQEIYDEIAKKMKDEHNTAVPFEG